MSRMTTAERRGFQQICDADGDILAIACDQRGGMRELLSPDPAGREAIGNDVLGETKADIVRHLANHASAVLLDPVCAVPAVVDDGVLARDVGLIIGLDASGFDLDDQGHRLSRLSQGVTARRVRELGGTAGKIMVYLRPDRGAAANAHNIAILRDCVADFAGEDLLLVVEFLTYALPGESKTDLAAMTPDIVLQGTRLSLDLGAKLLKLPYPGSKEACSAVTTLAAGVPWALLSAGVDHATFLAQVEAAMAAGAAGVIAGRALWKDCISLDRSVSADRLSRVARARLTEIKAVISRSRAGTP